MSFYQTLPSTQTKALGRFKRKYLSNMPGQGDFNLSYTSCSPCPDSPLSDSTVSYIDEGNSLFSRRLFQESNPCRVSEPANFRFASSLSKNALQARQNRLKKKVFEQRLQDDICRLNRANAQLSGIVKSQRTTIEQLREDVRHLKSVQANSTEIVQIMSTIGVNNNRPAVSRRVSQFSTSPSWTYDSTDPFLNTDPCRLSPLFKDIDMCSSEEEEEWVGPTNVAADHNYTCASKMEENEIDRHAGMCLHVSPYKVSLQFCSTCSKNSAAEL